MIKIAINGFGRIGRPVLRRILQNHTGLDVVAINDLTDNKTLAHLLGYDSVYRKYEKPVKFTGNSLIVGNKTIPTFSEKDPEKLPWKKLGVDVALECTGYFADLEGAKKHIKAGAKKVVISTATKGSDVPTFVLGVNAGEFDPKKHNIVDMGSCTTNALVTVVKVIHDNFRVKSGFMTTTHSYTNDQKILDLPHDDLRRARAAALNIIPTSTGAARAIGKVIPELEGKMNGIALRVPTATVSIVDFVCQVEKSASSEEVNKAFEKAAKSREMKGILTVSSEPLVSSDYIGSPYSSIVDAELTMTKGDLLKVVAWYDNEWGYACRLAEFAEYVGGKM